MTQDFEYDVFLSHSSRDRAAVRELAQRLKGDGLRVWFDEWVIRPGDSIPLAIERGLEASRTLVLAMSAQAFASDWVTLERHTALFRDPTNQQRRFIPVRLDDAEIKDALKQFAHVDWREKSEAEYARLLAACRSAPAAARDAGDLKHPLRFPVMLKEHTDLVRAVAITADGRRAISGSDDETVRVWDLEGRQTPRHAQGAYQPGLGSCDHRRRAAGRLRFPRQDRASLELGGRQTHRHARGAYRLGR